MRREKVGGREESERGESGRVRGRKTEGEWVESVGGERVEG